MNNLEVLLKNRFNCNIDKITSDLFKLDIMGNKVIQNVASQIEKCESATIHNHNHNRHSSQEDHDNSSNSNSSTNSGDEQDLHQSTRPTTINLSSILSNEDDDNSKPSTSSTTGYMKSSSSSCSSESSSCDATSSNGFMSASTNSTESLLSDSETSSTTKPVKSTDDDSTVIIDDNVLTNGDLSKITITSGSVEEHTSSTSSPTTSFFNKSHFNFTPVVNNKIPIENSKISNNHLITTSPPTTKATTNEASPVKLPTISSSTASTSIFSSPPNISSLRIPNTNISMSICSSVSSTSSSSSSSTSSISYNNNNSKFLSEYAIPPRLEYLLDMPPVNYDTQVANSWNPDDRSLNIFVKEADPLTLHRHPVAQSTDCIRTKIGYTRGIHLWELHWNARQRGTHAFIGVSTDKTPLHCVGYQSLIGSNLDSWGWDLGRNRACHNTKSSNQPAPIYPKMLKPDETFVVPDTFMMCLDMDEGTLSFLADGQYLGVAFRGLKGKKSIQ